MIIIKNIIISIVTYKLPGNIALKKATELKQYAKKLFKILKRQGASEGGSVDKVFVVQS